MVLFAWELVYLEEVLDAFVGGGLVCCGED